LVTNGLESGRPNAGPKLSSVIICLPHDMTEGIDVALRCVNGPSMRRGAAAGWSSFKPGSHRLYVSPTQGQSAAALTAHSEEHVSSAAISKSTPASPRRGATGARRHRRSYRSAPASPPASATPWSVGLDRLCHVLDLLRHPEGPRWELSVRRERYPRWLPKATLRPRPYGLKWRETMIALGQKVGPAWSVRDSAQPQKCQFPEFLHARGGRRHAARGGHHGRRHGGHPGGHGHSAHCTAAGRTPFPRRAWRTAKRPMAASGHDRCGAMAKAHVDALLRFHG